MGMKLLVPVMPTERFYDAVVAAGDLVSEKGGVITFLFTTVRPPPLFLEKVESSPSAIAAIVDLVPDTERDEEEWENEMIQALADARVLLYERGLSDDVISVVFADRGLSTAQSIADEAAAGGYDAVILSRGYLVQLPDLAGESGSDIAHEVHFLLENDVQLIVT